MDYPLEKYKYAVHERKDGSTAVIAISTYAGKTVRGVAVCHPHDNFDLETGKKLAALRCNAKIAEKRYRRACKQHVEAVEIFGLAEDYLNDMINYAADSFDRMENAKAELKDLLDNI